MKKVLFSLFVLILIFTFIESASATVIFDDNFNTENGGVGALNYTGFANWTVMDGTVDLIGNGYFDFCPGYGLYVDMDGSTSNAGKMVKTNDLILNAGQYILQFDLAGNHRNYSSETVAVQVGLGTLLNKTYSMGIYDPFTTFTEYFTVTADNTQVALSFEGYGCDNIGMLLDNVKISSETAPIPEPSTCLLFLLGIAGLAGIKKKF